MSNKSTFIGIMEYIGETYFEVLQGLAAAASAICGALMF
jgi:hypothetical protein